MNLLLHGPTGVGKSEFARVLAAELGATLHLAGSVDEAGESPDARERLSSLLLGHRLLGNARAVALFDELEDLFGPSLDFFESYATPARRTGPMFSKLWFTRLLEENAVPTIWIANDVRGVAPAYLRRFNYAIEFRRFTPAQRARVWARAGAEGLTTADLDELARDFEVGLGEITSAVRAAKLVGGGTVDRAALERVLASGVSLLTGRRPAVRLSGGEYRLDALNASTDLVALTDRLAGWKPGARGGLSLCLSGRSGTGKSEWARHLAERMGRKVIAKHASDVWDCWLGQTEKNIAAAFRQAEDEAALLLFDEVDGFLRDRRGAVYGWEVSVTNQLLQEIEAFGGIVAVTTNLFRDLDQAVLRRFVIKVEFLALRPEQALVMFDAYLGRFLPAPLTTEERADVAADLRSMAGLTLGDFALVARRLDIQGGTADAASLLRELQAELVAKGPDGKRMGF